jgi:ring-1,2-phenylacetyl-CoA epoxidase subunit PaaE
LIFQAKIGGARERPARGGGRYAETIAGADETRPAITVKRMREGAVSRYLHDNVRAGDTLVALEPTGSFTLDPDPQGSRNLALVAGGVGITQLISIAETVLSGTGCRITLLRQPQRGRDHFRRLVTSS